MTSRKHIDPMPPELLEQWEAELTLAELIKKLRDTRERISFSEQQLAGERELEAEALEAISAYRRHLGLEDTDIKDVSLQQIHEREEILGLRPAREGIRSEPLKHARLRRGLGDE